MKMFPLIYCTRCGMKLEEIDPLAYCAYCNLFGGQSRTTELTPEQQEEKAYTMRLEARRYLRTQSEPVALAV